MGSRQILLDAVAAPAAGVTEAYLHPAVDSPELEAMAADWEARVDDHRLLVHDPDLRGALDGAGVTLIGYRPVARPHAGRRLSAARRRPRPAAPDQYSVIAAISVCSRLYSGELVMGSSDITLAMLPVTFTLPCMKAALASSSPFWIFMASA